MQPETDGYIAILLTKMASHDKEMAKLITAEQYLENRLGLAASVEADKVALPCAKIDSDCKLILKETAKEKQMEQDADKQIW